MNPKLHMNLAVARGHLEAGRYDKAEAALLRLLKDDGTSLEVIDLLGDVAVKRGNTERALYYRRRAYALAPDDPTVALLLSIRLADNKNLSEAGQVCREFLQRHPDSPEVLCRLAEVCIDERSYAEATKIVDGLIAAHPDHAGAFRLRGAILHRQGRADESLGAYRHARRLAGDHPATAELIASMLNYPWGVDEREVFAAHALLGRIFEDAVGAPPFTHPRTDDPNRKLRIGLVSPDFRQHSTGYFIGSIIDHLDRNQFEIHCYYTHSIGDEFTDAMRARVASFNVALSGNAQLLAAKIHHDRIDILIELCGLMSGHRMPSLAMRPAPVQMTAIGYPNTTGLRTIDYRMVDSLTDPPDTDRWAIEKLIRLDPCFLCYKPPQFLINAEPRMTPAGAPIRFGCFNSAMKVNDQLLALFARVLDSTAGSILLIKAAGLEQPQMQAAFRERAARAGIAPERLEVMGFLDAKAGHLGLYNTIDVALDSYPYNGTTTTFEALAMGVPVVSLAGAVHRARVGLSILTNLGLPEWCVATPDAYVALARSLAADRPLRERLRTSLRTRLFESTLCDGPRYGQRLGAALRDAWRARCAAGASV